MKNASLLSWQKPMSPLKNIILFFTFAIIYTGQVFALEQTELDIICPDNTSTVTIIKEAQFFSDALEEDGEEIALDTYSCFSELASPGLHYFKAYSFQASTTDIYTFIGEISSPDVEAALFLFENDHAQLNNPCRSFLGQKTMLHNSPENDVLTASNRLSFLLEGGESYTLMVSTLSPANATGAYNIFAFAQNDGVLLNLPSSTSTIPLQITTDLVCTDLEELFLNEVQHYVVDTDGLVINDSIPEELQILLGHTGFPSISNNCGLVDVWISDTIIDNGDCGIWIIERTFNITDRLDDGCVDGPYTNECTQLISIRKLTLEDIFLPPYTAFVPCDSNYPTDGQVGGDDENPHASITGYPFLMTSFEYIELSDLQCTVGASYSDEQRINICDGAYKYRREWNLLDFCDPESSIIFKQLIKISDDVGPIIEISIPDYNNDGIVNEDCFKISTSSFSCVANWTTPIPTAIDGNGCSEIGEATVTIRTAAGNFVWAGQAGMTAAGLGIEDYEVCWCVSDNCGNESCICYCLEIRDDTAPNAFCYENINVSIGGGDIINGVEGIARLNPDFFSNNFNDNCGEVTLEIRRNFWYNDTCSDTLDQWSPWGEFVDFYCCDDNNEIMVELGITDETGNRSSCTSTITVHDNLPPFCFSPADIYISAIDLALEFPNGIEIAYQEDSLATINIMNTLFGTPVGTDNCAVDTIVEIAPIVMSNDCGTGTIIRQFEVWQWRPEGDVNNNNIFDREEAWVSTNTCAQTITPTVFNDFLLDFPQDAVLYCGDSCIWDLQTDIDTCGLFTILKGDPIRIPATGDECYQLSITYDVTNRGVWDGIYEGYIIPRMTEDEDDLLGGIVESAERPVLFGNRDSITIDRSNTVRTICPDGSGGFSEDDDSSLSNTSCVGGDPSNADLCRGRWIYTQLIKVYDTIAPIIMVAEFGGATSLCPDLIAGQFCAPIDNNAVIGIPFSISDECNVFGTLEESSMLLVSAQVDLFASDQNEDGIIDEAEFIAEPGSDGDVTANITGNTAGEYFFAGAFPIIPEEENTYHAIRILLEDDCGNQGSEIIYFDVLLQEEPDAVENISETGSGFTLYQNRPNPFNNETIISFHIPTSSEVTIVFRDINGRLLHSINDDYLVGFNNVFITKTMFEGINGVISYTITYEDFVITKKMVVVK